MQEHETTASEELIMLLRLWQQQPPNSVRVMKRFDCSCLACDT
jgi:hypothetical protein